MEVKKITLCLIITLLSTSQNVNAASTWSSGNPNSGDLYASCASLATHIAGQRRSFCVVYSPDETLDQLELHLTAIGQNATPPECDDPYNYGGYTDPPVGYDHPGYGDDEVVTDTLYYDLTYSWREDTFYGTADWSFFAGSPPSSGSTDGVELSNTAAGTAGNCY